MINLQNVKAKVGQDFESICPFPIGAIYTSMTDTSPAESFGGTWTVIDGGKYLRAASDSKTGGSDTISVEQMPSHSHTSIDSIVRISANTSGPCVADSANTPAWWYAWANKVAMSYTGGGNRSTRRTKTCTLGTESPNQEGGDAKWHSLTSLKFSTLLGRFAFRQYLRLQQKSLAARGNRSQTEGSGVHEIRMAQLADKIPSCSTIRTSRGDSGILMGTALLGRGTIQKSKMQLIQEACLGLALERKQMVLWNKFKRFPFIALVIVGSESPSLLAVA